MLHQQIIYILSIACKPLFVLLFLGTYLVSGAQTSGKIIITGKVVNQSNQPLAYASVVLLNSTDSTHIDYTTTNNNGFYKIAFDKNLKPFLRTSYLGYKAEEKNINISIAEQEINFKLEPTTEVLKQAVIKGRMLGAKVKGDTISYNIDKYVDGSELTLKDILAKLPGIEIDDNGRVRAQGKLVEKVLIDGKEFFLNNTQLATKTLPAKMVEGVDLINNYADIGMLGDSKPQGISALSITIKEEYRGRLSGNISAGGGVKSKYATNANLFQFNKKLSTAFIGDINNTGEMIFSLEDYIQFQGGIKQLTRRNKVGDNRISFKDIPILSFNDNVRSKKGETGAFNLSYVPNNKFKINSYVIANHQIQKGEEIQNRRFIDDESTLISNKLIGKNKFAFVNAYLSADYQPTEKILMSNRLMLNAQNHNVYTNIFNIKQSSNDTLYSVENAKIFDLNNYLMILYKTNRGDILTIDAFYKYNRKPSNLDLSSDSLFLGLPFRLMGENSLYKSIQDNIQNTHEFSLVTEYSYQIKNKTFIKPQLGISYSPQKLNTFLYQDDNGSPIIFTPETDYKNKLRYNNLNANIGLYIQSSANTFRYNVGLEGHYNSIYKKNTDGTSEKNDKWALAPYILGSIYFAANHHVTAVYSLGHSAQKINNMAEGKVITSYKTIEQGAIDNFFYPTQTISVNYMLANFQKSLTIMAAVVYTKESDQITYNHISHYSYSELFVQGATNSEKLNSFLRFRKGLGDLPFDVKLGMTYAHNTYYNFINGNENKIIIDHLRSDFSLISFYKGVVNGEAGMEIAWMKNTSKYAKKTTELWTFAPFAKLKINAGKGWLLTSSIKYNKYDAKDMRKNVSFLDAALHYRPEKSKFEFELNATNMLNLNKTERIASIYKDNYFQEKIYQMLSGYVLFKITFQL